MSYWLFKTVVASSLLYQNYHQSQIQHSSEEIERILKQSLNDQAHQAFLKENVYTIRKGLEVAAKKVEENPHQALFFAMTVLDFFRSNKISTALFPEIADKIFFDQTLEIATNILSACHALLDQEQCDVVEAYITAKQCVNLTKRFGHFTAVDDVSFSVAKGSIFGFLEPSLVAAGILPAVEGAHLAARKKPRPFGGLSNGLKRGVSSAANSAGLEARLYGKQDVCRYNQP